MSKYAYRMSYRRTLPHLQPPGATLFVTFRLADSIPQGLLAQWVAQRERALAEAGRQDNEAERTRAADQARREMFVRLEGHLDSVASGPHWLKDARVAELVAECLRYRDSKVYDLLAYCIMPNHVHVVFTPRPMSGHNLAECVTEALETDGHNLAKCVTEALGTDEHNLAKCVTVEPVPQYWSLPSILHSLKLYTAIRANRILQRSGQFWAHESYDHFVRDENQLGRIARYVLNNPLKAGLAKRWQDWPWSYNMYGAP